MRKRGKTRRAFSRDAGWQAIKRTLVGGMYEQHAESSQQDLLLPAYGSVLSLSRGTLDVDGYFLLNEMNAAGFCLMEILYKQGSDAVKADVLLRAEIPSKAADALASIGERYNRTGKLGATGAELQAVRAAVTNLDELVRSAPVGVLVQALQRAADMIDKRTKRKGDGTNQTTNRAVA